MNDLLPKLRKLHTEIRDCLKPLVKDLIVEVKSPQGLTQYGYDTAISLIAENES